MKLEADIRVVVRVPFETQHAETSEQRIAAARHAETVLLKSVKKALAGVGVIVDELVEAVRES